jgi:hypothetical protein
MVERRQTPRVPFWSNCFAYAVGQWWAHGGYVVVYRSHFGWWPHFLWSPDLKTFYEFMPVAPKRRRIFPPLWFRGTMRIWRGTKELDVAYA